MCWHHRMCEYANYPYTNVIPKMPAKKKVNEGGEIKELQTGAQENPEN